MYKNLYRTNPEKGNLIIDVSLNGYKNFYHEWDNAVKETRDMNPTLSEFIEICSGDIPLRNKIEIVFGVMNEQRDQAQEEQIKESFQNYYGFFLDKKRKNSRGCY